MIEARKKESCSREWFAPVPRSAIVWHGLVDDYFSRSGDVILHHLAPFAGIHSIHAVLLVGFVVFLVRSRSTR